MPPLGILRGCNRCMLLKPSSCVDCLDIAAGLGMATASAPVAVKSDENEYYQCTKCNVGFERPNEIGVCGLCEQSVDDDDEPAAEPAKKVKSLECNSEKLENSHNMIIVPAPQQVVQGDQESDYEQPEGRVVANGRTLPDGSWEFTGITPYWTAAAAKDFTDKISGDGPLVSGSSSASASGAPGLDAIPSLAVADLDDKVILAVFMFCFNVYS